MTQSFNRTTRSIRRLNQTIWPFRRARASNTRASSQTTTTTTTTTSTLCRSFAIQRWMWSFRVSPLTLSGWLGWLYYNLTPTNEQGKQGKSIFIEWFTFFPSFLPSRFYDVQSRSFINNNNNKFMVGRKNWLGSRMYVCIYRIINGTKLNLIISNWLYIYRLFLSSSSSSSSSSFVVTLSNCTFFMLVFVFVQVQLEIFFLVWWKQTANSKRYI